MKKKFKLCEKSRFRPLLYDEARRLQLSSGFDYCGHLAEPMIRIGHANSETPNVHLKGHCVLTDGRCPDPRSMYEECPIYRNYFKGLSAKL